ncbi:hypothetical protein EDD18DRAFT_1363558 [Armillaria luteobubalina]|uniref:Uncharacterized protein n=1 Tax=Armillaria luteobubalina TaxID=153913 RepID=A0AA39PBG2_9AGAR|nr:hypothetical protein EDD18DRAFT_1363558 [Armillaria luteobubalina]
MVEVDKDAALLKHYQITDIDIDFRESFYTCEAGPQLLGSIDVVSPLTPTLGLCISTKARPHTQGMMALYLAKVAAAINSWALKANINYVCILMKHQILTHMESMNHSSTLPTCPS